MPIAMLQLPRRERRRLNIAAELAINMAAPTPWKIRTHNEPDARWDFRSASVTLNSNEKNVNTAKPRL